MLVTANIFQPLIDVFEAVIKFFHHSLGVPWGWAIVLLTVVIRALLIPLAVKQYHSMQRLQVHMPELKAIQAKYKDDKQRQQQEMMKFYSENKVNPFASCLPLVAQLPVFISLFYMLRSSLRKDICPELQTHHIVNGHTIIGTSKACAGAHGSSFLFIHDLTSHGTGITLIVLIVLYVGTQLVSSLLMSAPTMDRNQRLMMMVMPLFFVIFVINFPTGVLVYWITTNLWTMAQQWVIRTRLGPVTTAVATAPGAGPPGGPATGTEARAPTDGGGGGSGLGALIRSRAKPAASEKASGGGVATRTREGRAAPPPPPRKKKKRSGRRR